MKKEYSLVEVAHNSINDDNNRVNVGKNQVNSVDNTQSKVKESKVNNNAPASASPDFLEEDDEGMDPDEAYRIWKEQQEKKNES